VESTRQVILDLLRRRKQATVEDLTQALSLAPATIRRHLDILMRDSYVAVDQVRRETGRPHYVFSLTDAGEDLFPKNYVRLTNRLIEEIVALEADETKGKDGAEIADLVFEKMAERLAQTYASRVTGETLGERVAQVAELLSDEGLTLDWQAGDEGFLLLGYGCPCRRVADSHSQMCSHDRRLLTQLLDADVEFVDPSTVGAESYCAYRITERAGARSGAL
jgi:DeoR family suf operon transcriptional repressor